LISVKITSACQSKSGNKKGRDAKLLLPFFVLNKSKSNVQIDHLRYTHFRLAGIDAGLGVRGLVWRLPRIAALQHLKDYHILEKL